MTKLSMLCFLLYLVVCAYISSFIILNYYFMNQPSSTDIVPSTFYSNINSSDHKKNILLLMIDNRLHFSQSLNISSYADYTFCINLLYCQHFHYTLIVVDPLTNDPKHTCLTRYSSKEEKVPMEWCKLEILNYYLSAYEYSEYEWLLYLDSDAHIIQFNTSFIQWLNHISSVISVPNLKNIHLLVSNDTPLFIERELPRLQSKMKYSRYEHNCNTYANAGVLVFRMPSIFSNVTLEMIEDWAKTINKIPSNMIQMFPREQGSLNCFITDQYAGNIAILPAFSEINIDWFYRRGAFIQHITSGMPKHRIPRFHAFLKQLIENIRGKYDSERYHSFKTFIPQTFDEGSAENGSIFEIIKNISDFGESDNIQYVVDKCYEVKHTVNERRFGSMYFNEYLFRF